MQYSIIAKKNTNQYALEPSIHKNNPPYSYFCPSNDRVLITRTI